MNDAIKKPQVNMIRACVSQMDEVFVVSTSVSSDAVQRIINKKCKHVGADQHAYI